MHTVAVTALVCALGLALSGCTYDPLWGVRTDVALWAQVSRRAYFDPRDLALACLEGRGLLTRDRKACLLLRGRMRQCVFVAAPYDRAHDRELTALCNGWRPFR